MATNPQIFNFSIVFPALRWEWLEVAVDSIYETAKEPEKIDIHVAFNTTDVMSPIIGDRLKNKYPTFEYYKIDHTTMMLPTVDYVGIVPYINYLTFRYSKGKYIMPFNDDALITSKDWDIKAFEKLEASQEIVLGLTNDNIRPGGFEGKPVPACSFPLISRKGIEYFGFLFDPFFYHNTADTNICWRYYSMGKTVSLEDCVMIEHRPARLCNWEFMKEDRYQELTQIIKEKST